MNKYNIIGDIHGRTSWKELVINDGINVFVGDYFSPYDDIEFKDVYNNFMEIIEFKKKHPETILLLGNHDDQHYKNIDPYVTRFHRQHVMDIKKAFEENSDLFQVVCSINNKVLVSHAGVSKEWYEFYFLDERTEERLTPDIIATNINKLWETTPFAFCFSANADYLDHYGESNKHSPMWIRPSSFSKTNILQNNKDYLQVFGHTQVKLINTDLSIMPSNFVMIDILGIKKNSLIIEFDEKGNYTLTVNKK